MKIPTLPSIVWVILLPLALILFIGGITLGFYALANIEGVASIVLLVTGFAVLRAGSSIKLKPEEQVKGSSFALAIGIVFFALMGISVDQPGNIFYNKPIEWIFCRDGSQLQRGLIVLHPLPGRTDLIQDFVCVKDGEAVRDIDQFEVIGVRFFEYVLLGYLLIGINKLINKRKLESSTEYGHHSLPNHKTKT